HGHQQHEQDREAALTEDVDQGAERLWLIAPKPLLQLVADTRLRTALLGSGHAAFSALRRPTRAERRPAADPVLRRPADTGRSGEPASGTRAVRCALRLPWRAWAPIGSAPRPEAPRGCRRARAHARARRGCRPRRRPRRRWARAARGRSRARPR